MSNKSQTHRLDFIEFPADNVSDLARTKSFFAAVFGWSYHDWGVAYADTKDSGLGSGINADPKHRPSHPLAVIYTHDLESVRENILAAQGKITTDTVAFPGGRRFHFTDPAGNELAVWSDR